MADSLGKEKNDLVFIYDVAKLEDILEVDFVEAFDFGKYVRGRVCELMIDGRLHYVVLDVEDIDVEEPTVEFTEELHEKIGRCLVSNISFTRWEKDDKNK